MNILTLPTDSEERKRVPMVSGLLAYFPAALAGVARVSYEGNKKHNGNAPLQHSRWLSSDHDDCVLRHLVDVMDLLSAFGRSVDGVTERQILTEVSCLAWRALAMSQELHEAFGNAPLAPAARNKPDCEDAE